MHHQVVHCNSQILICLQFIPLQGNRDNIASYQPTPVFKLALHSQAQPHSEGANTVSIPLPVYYFMDRFSMSHQAALVERFRGTGIWLKGTEDPYTPTLIHLHTKKSTRNFSGHHYIHRAPDIWVLAVVESNQALQTLLVRLKTVVEGSKSLKACKRLEQRVPGSLQRQPCMAGSWMGGLAPREPSACFLPAANSWERSE